jgi:hypothetical protein
VAAFSIAANSAAACIRAAVEIGQFLLGALGQIGLGGVGVHMASCDCGSLPFIGQDEGGRHKALGLADRYHREPAHPKVSPQPRPAIEKMGVRRHWTKKYRRSGGFVRL